MEKLENLKKEHNIFKNIVLIIIIISLFTLPVSMYIFYKLRNDLISSIWIVNNNGNATLGYKVNNYNYEGRKYEYKAVIENFMYYRYSGDRYNYKKNINKAIELTNYIGKEIYNDYLQEGFAKNIVNKNYQYGIVIDSIFIVSNHKAIGYSRQILKRDNLRDKIRNIYVEFEFEDISRSEKNPNGVVIVKLKLFNNEILE